MGTVTSKDGTTIAFEQSGAGPAVILVGGATQTRAGNADLAALLAPRFTVYNHDRRGRGESGDTPPYAVEREVEDIQALIAAAGGSACVYGTSSGSNLALAAAARGLAITKLALWEPIFSVDAGHPVLPAGYVEHINELVSAGRRGDALELFFTQAAGMPAEFVAQMRQAPFWSAMEAVAHTLAYDGAVVEADMASSPPPRERWAAVTMPTLVLDGGTIPHLSGGARAMASALPHARHRALAGQPHNVDAGVMAPVLAEFFAG
ncbi:MAG TPA: alpha/beta fold hydrolase [Thermomicrobiales bacterium]|nr:alpha/beta fold hydrolase [Thermomicrobiales bacterium]